MQTTKLNTYAPKARRDFIAAVTRRAAAFGLTAKEIKPNREEGELVFIDGQAYPKTVGRQRQRLVERIRQHGFEQVMEAAAYTWFNRFAAIRFMELHGYLDHSFRVLSHPSGGALPEILEQAQHVELPGLDRERVIALKMDGTQDEALYRDLLLAQCRALHQAMPFLFEPVDDETELLLPDRLLQTDSLIRELVTAIPEEDWQQIEIIGWLYQFYISEKKDQVIGKVVKSEDIPAATQLFTPNWIVKYMVQNSLGAQWLATYPDSPLKGQMDYYIEPAEQTPEVQAQLDAITPKSLNPEELTLMDPACGSGHILVEAYELFKAIYLERGYRPRDIPSLILEKNLYGLDIDPRAAQLAGFALMMKAREDDRRLFERELTLNVMALVDSAGFDAEQLAESVDLAGCGLRPVDLTDLKRLFEHATTFGSLIQVSEALGTKLPALKRLSEATNQDLFVLEDLERLGLLVQQAELLMAQYGAVVANPPYIGSKFHVPVLKKFLKDHYDRYEKDVFSAFIDRDLAFSKPHGRLGFMSPFVWMFVSSHEHLRSRLINDETITSLVQLEYSGFEGATVPICTFTLQEGHVTGQKGCFIRLSDFRGSESQGSKTLEAIRRRDCGWFFETSQDDFTKIPGNPVAYWATPRMLDAFLNYPTLSGVGNTRLPMTTGDNARFMRHWFEVGIDRIGFRCASRSESLASRKRWFPCNKGGSFRRWWGNNDFVVDWENDGKRILSLNTELYGSPSRNIRSMDCYFRESVTWSSVSSAAFSARYAPEGFLFATGGSSAFPEAEHRNLVLAALLSNVSLLFLQFLSPTLNFEVGTIGSLPLAAPSNRTSLSSIVSSTISLAQADWDGYERSWDFQSLPLLGASLEPIPNLECSYCNWITESRETIAEMKRLEEENNRLFIDAYGLQDELTPDVPIEQITLTVNPAYRYGKKVDSAKWIVDRDFGEELESRFREDTMKELVSYAIGCAMGRYRLDRPGLIYAHSGNERFWEIWNGEDVDNEKWIADKELAASAGGGGLSTNYYPLSTKKFRPDEDGIIPITDTDWFDDDATHRVVEFISVAFGEVDSEKWIVDSEEGATSKPPLSTNHYPLSTKNLEENLNFLAANLSPKKSESSRDTLRRYLADKFFKDHLQTYKKRPIYWCFSSGKQKAFQCLVYLHRYNEGTLARMRMEYVVPLQSKIAARIDALADDIEAASSGAQAKRLQKERDKLGKQLDELRHFDEQLRHYADQRIALDLDDGVKVNYGKFGNLLAEVKAVTGKSAE
ncbi:SAM-dependent methyltransferase [Thiohalocapsa halophila]|uniref:site-specific DNA-methyltransferase (adenine-specific) n=1 Tax=Thiohalocapsa halophila TaxID=69359 RepID=A0ABS1CKX9_9GAMM|nr:BREX-1 system adenine-specific DNA-methyltransferase PglX [Thiohalocapsa halophila]MBK1631991.1 SAM-dependent methyltransferase [Thiohalocapsa halophila]